MPSASEPVSPMKMSAGNELNQRKPDAGAGERGGEDGGVEHVGAICDGRHDDHDDHDRARCQTVKAVGEVHGVAHAHEQDVHEQEVEPRDGDAVADRNAW